MSAPAVLRFAPTPNGELHLGHALSAFVGYDMARRLGGRFLVRIEDIDTARCRDDYADGILDMLVWLGLTWEQPVLRQSQHFDRYAAAARQLRSLGLLYPCFATRTEIAESARDKPLALDPDGAPLYPGLHKRLSREDIDARIAHGEPYALRLDMETANSRAQEKLKGKPLTFVEVDTEGRETTIAAEPQRWGDAVIVRKETPASYHLAVVVDDARQGITHVTRGEDLKPATGIHRLLQVLLDLPEPVYHHHRLITDRDGRKLSKSAGDTSLDHLRQQGMTPQEVRRLVGLN